MKKSQLTKSDKSNSISKSELEDLVTALENELSAKNHIIQGLTNRLDKYEPEKNTPTAEEATSLTAGARTKTQSSSLEPAGHPADIEQALKDLQQHKEKIDVLTKEFENLKIANGKLDAEKNHFEKELRDKEEQFQATEKRYDVLMKKMQECNISMADLNHIPPEGKQTVKNSNASEMTSSLFTIRIYKTSEGFTGIIHHPISHDRLNFRPVDGKAISSFISSHVSSLQGQAVAAQKVESDVESKSAPIVEKSIQPINKSDQAEPLKLVFKQNDKECSTERPILSKKTFSIELYLHIPEMAERTGLPNCLSHCSLWLAIRKSSDRGYVHQASQALKLIPQKPDIKSVMAIKGLEAGTYTLSYRITIPLIFKTLQKSILITVVEGSIS